MSNSELAQCWPSVGPAAVSLTRLGMNGRSPAANGGAPDARYPLQQQAQCSPPRPPTPSLQLDAIYSPNPDLLSGKSRKKKTPNSHTPVKRYFQLSRASRMNFLLSLFLLQRKKVSRVHFHNSSTCFDRLVPPLDLYAFLRRFLTQRKPHARPAAWTLSPMEFTRWAADVREYTRPLAIGFISPARGLKRRKHGECPPP